MYISTSRRRSTCGHLDLRVVPDVVVLPCRVWVEIWVVRALTASKIDAVMIVSSVPVRLPREAKERSCGGNGL